jgi:hypothetical protein
MQIELENGLLYTLDSKQGHPIVFPVIFLALLKILIPELTEISQS